MVLDLGAYAGVRQIGVAGCAQRATYVWDANNGWVRDSAGRYPPPPEPDPTSP